MTLSEERIGAWWEGGGIIGYGKVGGEEEWAELG